MVIWGCFTFSIAMHCYIILNLLLFVISISIDFSTFVITVYKCILSCGGFYRWLMLTIYPTLSNSDCSPSFYKLSSTVNSEVQHLTSPKPLFFAGTVFGNIFDNHMDVSKNRGTPQIIHFNRVFDYKPSILGYPYFWKHPYVLPLIISKNMLG